MKAYAILSGAGIKGAVLAGCVSAARDLGIEFVGFGGSSSGSIVALLASIGYEGELLRHAVVDEMSFDALLDDGGTALTTIRRDAAELLEAAGDVSKLLTKAGSLWRLSRHVGELGLYDGCKLEAFLRRKVHERVPALASLQDFTFDALLQHGGKPLKVVATDLSNRRAAVFGGPEPSFPLDVLQAVRASAAYPFVFKPITANDSLFVDGGLVSSRPMFLFAKEQEADSYPIIAFDVVPTEDLPGQRPANSGDALNRFVRDLLTTALEGSDVQLRKLVRKAVYIPIRLPDRIDAMDLLLDRPGREKLYRTGYEQAKAFLQGDRLVQFGLEADTSALRGLQLIHGPPVLYQPVLEAVARECERVFGWKDVRASIMLRTRNPDGVRMVVYHFNMEDDPDRRLVINDEAGCSGTALTSEKGFAVANLENVRERASRDGQHSGMFWTQVMQVPADRKSMASMRIPVWGGKSQLAADPAQGHPPGAGAAGALSIDTTTPFADSGLEMEATRAELQSRLHNWAQILSALLDSEF